MFHGAAVNTEILLAHYQIGLGISVNEADLAHIPETIILNNYGAKNLIYHWSDLTAYDAAHHKYKAFNLFLTWGKAHSRGKRSYIDNTIETGCWLKHNFSESARHKKSIYEKLGLQMNGRKVIAFYDASFSRDIHFTEEVLLDFWQMMLEIIEKHTNVIAILKPQTGNEWYAPLSDKGREVLTNIKRKCLESQRFYFIDNPGEIAVTEVIAISDINITMGICSPSTIALLCGKIGLFYDITGNDYHPFIGKYGNKVVFNNRRDLLAGVNRIISTGYSPLGEIEEKLLRDYDSFPDDRGLERFREALVENL